MLRRSAVVMAAGLTALAFVPSAAAMAAPIEGSNQSVVRDESFVGEGRGRLNDALREAENDAFNQARRSGYERRDCSTERIQRDDRGNGNWIVRHTISCENGNGGPGPGRDLLVNAISGLCFDAGRNARDVVTLEECDGRNGQRVDVDRRAGTIKVFGQCLEPERASGREAEVVFNRCDGSRDQEWSFNRRGMDLYEIQNDRRDMCLDVLDRNPDEGSEVGVRRCSDNDVNQEWLVGDRD
ncbi:hypothetical protein GCM10010201_32840 [Pilimelia columellifera subsp. columellifera]|uniref:Ricin B lectin domain-containing protein n=2 Tax=Pilimelia TaxID=53370 RepID=A0ABP6B0S9_9ACTN